MDILKYTFLFLSAGFLTGVIAVILTCIQYSDVLERHEELRKEGKYLLIKFSFLMVICFIMFLLF